MEKVSEVDFKEKSVLSKFCLFVSLLFLFVCLFVLEYSIFSFSLIELESQHRITALKFVIPNYPKYPVFSKFPTHVNIQYRLDIFEDFEDVVENGELKVGIFVSKQ